MTRDTDSGYRVGDPCEAIEAYFSYGPQTCMKTSVTTAVDATWGTTHVVCADHAPEHARSWKTAWLRAKWACFVVGPCVALVVVGMQVLTH